jgi:hypothetical protein
MIKIFTEQYYAIENSVNTWLEENEGRVEVQRITQSSCITSSSSTVQVTIMIEYIELITNFGSTNYPSLDEL